MVRPEQGRKGKRKESCCKNVGHAGAAEVGQIENGSQNKLTTTAPLFRVRPSNR